MFIAFVICASICIGLSLAAGFAPEHRLRVQLLLGAIVAAIAAAAVEVAERQWVTTAIFAAYAIGCMVMLPRCRCSRCRAR